MSAVLRFNLYVEELILRGELDLEEEFDSDEQSEDESEYAIVAHQELGSEEEKAFKNKPDVDKDSGSSEEGKASTSGATQLAQVKRSDDEAHTGDKRRHQQQQTQQLRSYGCSCYSYDADDEADPDDPPKRRRRTSFAYIRPQHARQAENSGSNLVSDRRAGSPALASPYSSDSSSERLGKSKEVLGGAAGEEQQHSYEEQQHSDEG